MFKGIFLVKLSCLSKRMICQVCYILPSLQVIIHQRHKNLFARSDFIKTKSDFKKFIDFMGFISKYCSKLVLAVKQDGTSWLQKTGLQKELKSAQKQTSF